MGYFEIGIYHTKTETNVGTLWRSAYQLGAAGIFTIGKRYKKQSSDTYKAILQIPLRHYADMDAFREHRPHNAPLIGIEMGGMPLRDFRHPKTAVYLLGAEDHGLPPSVVEYCDYLIALDAVGPLSYNVAVAGSIVMYHRVFLNGM